MRFWRDLALASPRRRDRSWRRWRGSAPTGRRWRKASRWISLARPGTRSTMGPRFPSVASILASCTSARTRRHGRIGSAPDVGWSDANIEIVVTQPTASPVKDKMWSHHSHRAWSL
jgi:hypothetical protein